MSQKPITQKPITHIKPFLKILFIEMVGRSGLEPPTSPLSGVRSNHLS